MDSGARTLSRQRRDAYAFIVMAERHASGLTSSELRLLPLLTTQLSLNEISQILEMPRDVVVALAQSIYMKLGPLGENASRLSAP